ncbi:MAG: tRNA pseudouridine(55) synthase TruB [Kofleriaceae bacterium]
MPGGRARRAPRPDWLHGAIVVDKPGGVSSGWVVEELRRRLGIDAIGHTGTLDPMASGVLPLVLGQATKLAGFLLAEHKAYDAVIELGVETDTLDREGRVTARAPAAAAAVTEAEVRAALASWLGPRVQTPPAFSAIKVQGRRLYQRALSGEEVAAPTREVVFHELTLRAFAPPRVELSVACSKGTFVRALARDLGQALGCGAHLTELRRTRSGRFTLADAHPMAKLHRTSAPELLVPLASVAELPRVAVAEEVAADIEHGRRVRLPELPAELANGEVFQLVTPQGWVIAVARMVDGLATYDRVLRRADFAARSVAAGNAPP